MDPADRRRHPRHEANAAYTPALVRLSSEDEFARTAHIRDVSEGGIRLEVDIAVDPGTPVAVQIMLPGTPISPEHVDGPGMAVFCTGNVVWCNADEPGPATLAVAITRFSREGDFARLMRRLNWTDRSRHAA